MTKKILSATGPQTSKPILRVEADGGQVLVQMASSAEVRDELLAMIRDGLVQASAGEGDPFQRITPSSDPAFLEQLARVLQREFGLRTQIQDAPLGPLDA